jgi:tRNA dimethylallyltransferase
VIVIVGPTGVGKTEVALSVAGKIKAEIISADSRQVYQELSAGTAKPGGHWSPTPQGLRYIVGGVVHHLLDHVPPHEPYTAGRFTKEAVSVLADLTKRNVPAIIVGGTGLYLRALTRGLALLPPADLVFRKELLDRSKKDGRESLHRELSMVDPSAAQSIPANNIQRVIRALEVHSLTGRPLTELQKEGTLPAPWDFSWFGLRWEDAAQYQDRLKQRCESMAEGILSETSAMLSKGIPDTAPAFQSLGYREAIAHQSGHLSRAEFDERFLKLTRSYVKRQFTWFRGEPEIRWLLGGGTSPSLTAIAGQILSQLPQRGEPARNSGGRGF